MVYSTDLFDACNDRAHGGPLCDVAGRDRRGRGSENQRTAAADGARNVINCWWSGTTRPPDYPREKCVHELFEEQVERTPDAVAVVFEDQELTYRELNERANQLAHHLRRLGVGPETLVGLCLERSPELVVGILGILKAGGAYLPLDADYPPQRLEFMLTDAAVESPRYATISARPPARERLRPLPVLDIEDGEARRTAATRIHRSTSVRGQPRLRDVHLRIHRESPRAWRCRMPLWSI